MEERKEMETTREPAKETTKETRKAGFALKLPSWLFIWLMTLFCEIMLHIWNVEGFNYVGLHIVVLFAGAYGAFLALIVSFVPPKFRKQTSLVLAFIMVVFTLMQHFLRDSYQVYMSPSTIISGAGGVAKDYFGLIMSMLVRQLWRILLMMAPPVLYAIWGKRRKCKGSQRARIGISSAVLFAAAFLLVAISGNGAALKGEFDDAVQTYGLHIGVWADLLNDGESAPQFEIPDQPDDKDSDKDSDKEGSDGTEGTGDTQDATEPPVVYGENVMDIDFASLAQNTSDSSIASIHSYVASLKPSMENEYTGMFKGKNLIFITAEAFSAEVIDPELTPTLYRLATKGIQFKDYYQPAWGGSTSTGEFTNITGLMPANGVDSIKEGTQQDMFLLIGKQLQKLDYHSVAYHNHDYTYYGRNKTHTALGYDEFIGLGNGMEEGVKKRWPESDKEMMDFSVQQYIDKQPFSVYYMTVSGHCLYSTGGNNMSKKNIDAVAHLDCSDTVKAYLAANLELEYAMQSLVSQLEAAGIADDTLIVLATDHYPYGLEKSATWKNDEDYLSELYGKQVTDCFIQDHSALIMWSASLEDKNIVVDTPVYSLDILPTLSNLFGVDYDSRLMVGRDVFSDADPLVFWPNGSWKTDKGSYNAKTKEFTAAPGVEVEDSYRKQISTIVNNKITYSKSVQNKDYFNYLARVIG